MASLEALARSLLHCKEPLSDEQADLACRLLGEIRKAPPPLWTPSPGPQTEAYLSEADVTGFGGSAGGGKTSLALGLALTAHRKSLILRRERTQTKDIVDQARALLGTRGSFNATELIWRGIPGDRTVEFGGCKDPGDEQAYRGRPHDLIVFDEADSFPEHVVRFISGWLRTTVPDQPCRMLLTFNPPSSAEGEWLLTYFAPWISDEHPRPAVPGELRWYAVLDGVETEVESGAAFDHEGETVHPRSRTFFPSRIGDNPYLRETGYMAHLQGLWEPLRSQLLYGDMRVGRQDDAWQVIPTAWVKAAQERWKATPCPIGVLHRKLSALGVDVAHGGADSTAISARWGEWFAPTKKYQGAVTDTGRKAAHLVLREHRDDAPCNVDAIGYGASCQECLEETLGRKSVAVNVSETTNLYDRSRKYRLTNLRAAMYWRLREALDPEHGDNLCLPPEAEMLADLCAPRYSVRASGIVVEAKEDLKRRIGRSPDVGDAVCLAHLDLSPVWETASTAPAPERADRSPPRIKDMAPGRRLFPRR